MSRYAISINRRAQKNLAAVPLDAYERIKKALIALGDDPRPHGSKKLKDRGLEDPHRQLPRRLRDRRREEDRDGPRRRRSERDLPLSRA
jgi:hypothetical protein